MTQINFKGKTYVRNHHLSVPHRPIQPDPKKSISGKSGPRLDGNLVIHGDNLHALKALLPMYSGKINCIYIDPPYNTGKEGWCYNDNVNSPQMQAWLQNNPITIEDNLRHDKWCAMMWPRLVLLRELLAENGIIFVSIDDNEQHHLRMIMDEIFGQQNHINLTTIVTNLKGNNSDTFFSGIHEYGLVYAKDKTQPIVFNNFEDSDDWDNWEEDNKGYWKRGGVLAATQDKTSPNTTNNFPIYVSKQDRCYLKRINKTDIELFPMSKGKKTRWYWGPEYFAEQAAENNILVVRTKDGISLYKKQRLTLSDIPQAIPKTVFYNPSYGQGGSHLEKVMGEMSLFQNPKSVDLIKSIMHIFTNQDSLVLDSFAGSGTTAHAVLELNKKDGGNRKFILIECEDYADKITAERVRRVIHGVPSAKDKLLKAGLGGAFTYCTLGKAVEAEKILNCEDLPSYKDLASLLFHTVTMKTIVPSKINEKSSYVGESENYHIWLIYKPNAEFLRSAESAFTLKFAQEIVRSKNRGGGGKTPFGFCSA